MLLSSHIYVPVVEAFSSPTSKSILLPSSEDVVPIYEYHVSPSSGNTSSG
jgi:hypothetical protein